MAEPEYLTAGGARLEIAWTGLEHGRSGAILLLHEGLGCVSLWRDFPQALSAATGRAVLAYSRQGYGRSDPCQLPRPLNYMNDEGIRVLPELIAAAGIEDGILFGHSDGASIAAIHAGALPDPGGAGLILMAPHFFTEPGGLESIAQARTAFATTDLRDKLARYHGDNVDCAFNGWCDAWLDPDFQRWDIRNVLGGITVPVLVVQGIDDQYGTVAQTEAPRRLCRGPVRVALLEDCRHAPHLEQPETTLAAVGEFLRDELP